MIYPKKRYENQKRNRTLRGICADCNTSLLNKRSKRCLPCHSKFKTFRPRKVSKNGNVFIGRNCLTCGIVISNNGKRCRKCASDFMRVPLEQRFWEKVEKTETCWIWKSKAKTTYGYGVLDKDMTHRISWRLHFGDIPNGLFVCHHCDNPPCVRPDHLFLGTPKDNTLDMVKKKRDKNQFSFHKS